MVIEVGRSVPLSAPLSPPPCLVTFSAHSCCPLASCSSTPAGAQGQVLTCLWASGGPSPPGLAVPLGHGRQEGGPLGLNPVLGPTEGSWWPEGPVPLPVHGPHRLHHPEAEVGLPAAQLHEPVSGQGA